MDYSYQKHPATPLKNPKIAAQMVAMLPQTIVEKAQMQALMLHVTDIMAQLVEVGSLVGYPARH